MKEERKAIIRSVEREMDEANEIVKTNTPLAYYAYTEYSSYLVGSNGNGDLEYSFTFSNSFTGQVKTVQVRSREVEERLGK